MNGTDRTTQRPEVLTPRAVDAKGHLLPISDEERRRRLPLELAALQAAWDIPPDETETDEAWDQILRNLGVKVPTDVDIPVRRGGRDLTRLIVLDTDPTSLAAKPGGKWDADLCHAWLRALKRAGHDVAVPGIARYEVRREIFRTGARGSLSRLDFPPPEPDLSAHHGGDHGHRLGTMGDRPPGWPPDCLG